MPRRRPNPKAPDIDILAHRTWAAGSASIPTSARLVVRDEGLDPLSLAAQIGEGFVRFRSCVFKLLGRETANSRTSRSMTYRLMGNLTWVYFDTACLEPLFRSR
jgi:hypothetical protein